MSDEIRKIKPTDTYRNPLIMNPENADNEMSRPLFLGGLSEQHTAIFETAMVFAKLNQMRSDVAQGQEVPRSYLNSMEVKYEELCQKHFENVSQEELGPTLLNYFGFIKRVRDSLLSKGEYDEALKVENLINTVEHSQVGRVGLVAPVPVKANKGGSTRERMRRSVLKVTGSPDSFAIILMNSRILLKAATPSPWDVATLINKIALALSGAQYGQRYTTNSIHLERALISRVILTWVLERLTYWSVSDVLLTEELLEVIEITDINEICMAVLATASPKGVPYLLTCLADKCGFRDQVLMDPADMTVYDHYRYPEAYMAQITDAINSGKRLSKQELRDTRLPVIGSDGNAVDTLIKIKGGAIEMKIGIPYASEYFTVFDYAANLLNKEIRELAVQFPKASVLEERRKELMSSFRMIDYIQYFETYTTKGNPMVDGDVDEVIRRNTDPGEFILGLIDIFNEETDLYADVLVRLIKTIPVLSYTFVGIRDDQCPGCRERAQGMEKELNGGFTPIDPVLNFFDQARILIAQRKGIGESQEEILS
jgi:hypothetical protein